VCTHGRLPGPAGPVWVTPCGIYSHADHLRGRGALDSGVVLPIEADSVPNIQPGQSSQRSKVGNRDKNAVSSEPTKTTSMAKAHAHKANARAAKAAGKDIPK
jgi:hypothetical protein